MEIIHRTNLFWKPLHECTHKYHIIMWINISLNYANVLKKIWSLFVQFWPKIAVFDGFLVHPGFFFKGTGLPQIWILISMAHTHKNLVLSQFWEIESIFVKSVNSLIMGLAWQPALLSIETRVARRAFEAWAREGWAREVAERMTTLRDRSHS